MRLTVDTIEVTMQAFYYLSDRPSVRFFSGIWDQFGGYKSTREIEDEATMDPTMEPTNEPTLEPTEYPTFEPSMLPSLEPTYLSTDAVSLSTTSDDDNPGGDGKKETGKNEKSLSYVLIGCGIGLVVILMLIASILCKRWKSHNAGSSDAYQSLLGSDVEAKNAKSGKKTSFVELHA